MNQREREALAVRLIEMNRAMRDLRDEIDLSADVAKLAGANDLAVATYHLSDSIAVYMTAMNNFLVRELKDSDTDATL